MSKKKHRRWWDQRAREGQVVLKDGVRAAVEKAKTLVEVVRRRGTD